MIYLYIYLAVGLLIGITKVPEEIADTLKRYPQMLPLVTSPVKKHKIVLVSVYGVVAIITMLSYALLWLPDTVYRVIKDLIKGGKK